MVSGTLGNLQSYFNSIPLAYPLYTLLAIIGLMYLFRIGRAIRGEKFSETRVFMTPVIYSVFVAFTFINGTENELIAALIDSVIGIAIGILLSGKIGIFTRKGRLYYKRSIGVATLFTTFFTLKIMALLYYPILDALFVSSILLTLVTGMIIGEAVRIFIKFRKYDKGSPVQGVE